MTGQEANGLVHEISCQVVPAFECTGCIDVRIIEYQVGSILVRLGIHEPVEAVEPAPQRPAIEWTC